MNWKFRVHRETLLASLGCAGKEPKLPPDMHETFYDHPVPRRDYERGAEPGTGEWVIRPILRATIKVYPGSPQAVHRVFIVCPGCAADVPYGRLHQHAGSKVCRAGCCRTLGLSEDTPPAIARDYALEHNQNDIAALLE